jgi:hypothetical protein
LGGIADGTDGHDQVVQLFDDTVTLRFCNVRADYVAGAVQAAQHLDRIPLALDTNPPPEVDILLPTKPADLPQLVTNSYGWVAFVRHSPISCDEETGEELGEPVETDSLEVFTSLAASGSSVEKMKNGNMPDKRTNITEAMFVRGTPTLQTPPDALDLRNFKPEAAVGVAPPESDMSLIAARVQALVDEWKREVPEIELSVTTAIGDFPQPFIVIFGQRRL